MTELWRSGELRDFLHGLLETITSRVEGIDEDELLSRSTDDLASDLVPVGIVEPLTIDGEPIDGDVSETEVDVSHDFAWNGRRARGLRVTQTFEYHGDGRLFWYTPSTRQLTLHRADVGNGRITVTVVRPGLEHDPDQIRNALNSEMQNIRTMAQYAAADALAHNDRVEQHTRNALEARRTRIGQRRNLAGALGFPMEKRQDAPLPVPLQRKQIGTARSRPRSSGEYRDEPALNDAQYEDALQVIRSTVLAMERTPSVAAGKPEEELRDQLLVQLNGTFTGGASGETFVQRGKTDILVMVDDRHVFVGECKWWEGPKACTAAIDQLLGYLPWRNEKAALILFIGRKDASAVIAKANEVVRAHPAFKRAGPASGDTTGRGNFVLGHPDDPAREIHLAVLFAVLPRGE